VSPATERTVTLTVNGASRAVTVDVRTLLSDLLRHELGLTGTHVGCEQGSCGACTVLVDGLAVRSCLAFAPQVEGAAVETVEGVAPAADAYHSVQRTLHENHGLQCGFCTPGIVMSLVAAHRAGVDVDIVLDDILGGHLCRCTGYVNIRAAVRAAWQELGS
jgi:aerobic-type carbon monoxide dehydrogenase small subunit (CoxS/CutS family)